MSNENYEFIKCAYCNEMKTTQIMKGKDLYNNIDGEFTVVKCDNCGFIYTNPRPFGKELLKYYPNKSGYYIPSKNIKKNYSKKPSIIYLKMLSSFLGYNNLYSAQLKDKFLTFPIYLYLKRGLEMEGIPKFIPNGKLLDVGCSYGLYLLKMKKLGWNVKGLELNKKAADFGKKELDLDIINDDFTNFPIDEKFDVITMRMVLEHLPNPLKQLEKANELLKKNGQLIIIVPNFEGMEFRLFKEYCYALQVPVHFNHFTPLTIQNFCDKSGFKIKKIIYQNADRDMVASAHYRAIEGNSTIPDRFLSFLLKNNIFRRSILRIFVNLLSLLGLSSRMTIWIQKTD